MTCAAWNGMFWFHCFAVHSASNSSKTPTISHLQVGFRRVRGIHFCILGRAALPPFLRLTLSISLVSSCAKSKQRWESNLFFVQYIPQNDKQYALSIQKAGIKAECVKEWAILAAGKQSYHSWKFCSDAAPHQTPWHCETAADMGTQIATQKKPLMCSSAWSLYQLYQSCPFVLESFSAG